jgi:conjugative relaxase-like TrwC/TraI family protein
VLTITKLMSAEYLISAVAEGVEDYFMGVGEAPGVWHGAWAAELGLEGVVEPEQLRALIEGRDPQSGVEALNGQRARTVKAFDVTLSCPKSVSLLWALGSQDVSQQICQSQVEAVTTALDFVDAQQRLESMREVATPDVGWEAEPDLGISW